MRNRVPPQFDGRVGPAGSPGIWMFLFLLALIGLAVLLFMQYRRSGMPVFLRPRPTAPPAPPAPAAPGSGPASGPGPGDVLGILKMRYARGEITRDEFLQIGNDLGVGVAAAGPTAAAPPAAATAQGSTAGAAAAPPAATTHGSTAEAAAAQNGTTAEAAAAPPAADGPMAQAAAAPPAGAEAEASPESKSDRAE